MHSPQESNITAPHLSRSLAARIWLAVLIAAAVFTVHGPLHAGGNYVNDFAAPYTSARLWLQHQNPYSPDAFWDAWHAAGGPLTRPGGGPVYANPSSTHSVYPPPSVVALSPFAMLSWQSAENILIGLSTALYIAALLLLTRLLPGTWRQFHKPGFFVLGLLFAPPQSALHVSNVTALAAPFVLLAASLLLKPLSAPKPAAPSAYQPQTWAIALLAALSLTIKPTLAPVLLVYLLYRHLWTTFIAALGITAMSAALFQLLQPSWEWLSTLQTNIEFLFTAGVADLAARNLSRSDRIDLQLPAYTLTHSRTAATWIAGLIALMLLTLWCKVAIRPTAPNVTLSVDSATQCHAMEQDRQLLLLSTLLVIGLLPFYQRFYSATLLLLPALWAIRNLANLHLRRHARWTLGLCCICLVNTSVLPRVLGLNPPPGGIFYRLNEIFITPHLCWILLVVTLVLLGASRTVTQNREMTNSCQAPKSTFVSGSNR
ncbi:hypothetical protein BH10ACI4_BH10ACI4_03200 [soil metagenome]